MKQENKEILLTVKDLNKLGAELTEIMQQLDMVNVAIQGLEFVERKDDLTFQWIARQFFTTNYTLNENISKKLDEIACYLLNADNERELKVLKMIKEKNEVFDIRNYLVQNNCQKGLIAMLNDYFTNKEINDIISLPKEEYQHFVNNYQLRGVKK